MVGLPHDEVSNPKTPGHLERVVLVGEFGSIAASPVIKRKGSPTIRRELPRRDR